MEKKLSRAKDEEMGLFIMCVWGYVFMYLQILASELDFWKTKCVVGANNSTVVLPVAFFCEK